MRRLGHRLVVWGLVAGVVLPLLPLLLWAFSRQWLFPELFPAGYSLRAWAYLFSPASQLGRAFVNSLMVAGAVTGLSLLVGVPAGRGLALYPFAGKRLVEFLILAPAIMPPISVAMGIHIAFLGFGLADTLLGLVLVHLLPVLPYTVLILSGVFAGYEQGYEEQARTLGANPWQVVWRVTLPLIRPGLVVAALFAFIICWSQYLLALLIGGGRFMTLPVLLFSFANGGDKAITAALSLLFVAPPLLLFVVAAGHLQGQNGALAGLGK